ncbi:MAG: hypothetical protein IJX15_06515 [Ruminiclostridium sp.]|nr:hypothetical protein [Ruminiclostridium sp.]MBQ8411361.1 hypothetical protein [Ruminiclostridium sp.]MBQ8842156.1 hypothetical protein [Ruminiclostridium sp.]
MSRYEFGIMDTAPEKGVRYDEYDPESFRRLVSVTDDYFEPYIHLLKGRLYLHTLDIESDTIEWTGINLIPPETCKEFAEILRTAPSELSPDTPEGISEIWELKNLLKEAYNEQKFIKLFGI